MGALVREPFDALLELAPDDGPATTRHASYRLGTRQLALDASAPRFTERFETLFGDCRANDSSAPTELRARVVDDDARGAVHLRIRQPDAERLDLMELGRALFTEHGYAESPAPAPGWSAMGRAGEREPAFAARAQAAGSSEAWFARSEAWPSLIGNLLVGAAIRAQGDVAFVHAGAVVVDGAAVLLVGDKGHGKTTLTLALAARGLALASDELAAVDVRTGLVHPVPRALSIRRGPRSGLVDERLQDVETFEEDWPDGTVRTRALASALFTLADAAPLRAVVFLGRMRARAALERFDAGARDVARFGLHPCSLATASPARRVFALASLLARAECYALDPGDPDATADLVLSTLRSS